MRNLLEPLARWGKHRPCLLGALLCLMPWLSSAAAQEWTRFRGPNGEGASEASTIPVQWTANDYRWRVELPGLGYSSPVLWGQRLFITAGLEQDATQIIQCRSAADGSLLWERRFLSTTHPKHQYNLYAASTPTVDADRVYLAFATPQKYDVIALDQATGRDAWRRDLGPFAGEHGFGTSPILFEGLLILANEQDAESSVVALDAKTGADRWTCPRRTQKTAYATPCIWRPDQGPPQLIADSWAHGVSSIDPRSGKPNWELPVFRNRVVGSPMIAGGLIFAACGTGGIGRQMVAVRPGNPATGTQPKVAYELSGSLPYVCTPVALGNLLFSWFDRGVVTCLDAPTGKIRWRERIGGDYFSSPIRVRDRIYNASRDGEMIVLAAAEQYKLLARFSLGERTHSTPAVANGTMYLRTVSHLMAVGGK
jgi:outer membrane protein assembly factor BamB